MKNVMFFLFFWANVVATCAQYTITTIGPYKYKITPDNPMDMDYGAWHNMDLITWICPDGQFLKKEIQIDNGIVLNQTDELTWTPYKDPTPMGSDQMQAYVTRKGGTGTPPPVSAAIPFSMLFGNTSPLSLTYNTGKYWQLSKSWEFSPDKEILLIFSYKPNAVCGGTGDEIRLHYNPDHLTYVGVSNFNAGIVIPSAGMIKIQGLTYEPNIQKNLYFKFKTKDITQVQVGQDILIRAAGKFCSVYDTIAYHYTVQAGPHDPNKKTVDIGKICINQTNPVKLTYTIQFQNDGEAPVKKIAVKDVLPSPQLDAESFLLITPLPENGIDGGINVTVDPANQTKTIEFKGIAGLPGIRQVTPYIYNYDQTIYRFSFEVKTKPTFQIDFDNEADVTFYKDNGTPIIPSIITTKAHVDYVDLFPVVDCYVPTLEAPDILGTIALKPNPFLDQINISFELKEKSKISLEVRDIWGRLIESVAAGEFTAGPQQFIWDGTTAPDGVYMIYLRTEKGSLAKKVVKVR